jgi:6-hydroxycyclohex-1-ene-1-carbonyl-CoA dehydrogenase
MAITAHRWLMTAVKAPLQRVDFDATPTAPAEVTVQIAGCGLCHTDLGYYYDGVRTNHPLPLALGHEIAGRVVAAGPGAESWLGKAVIVPSVMPCGECEHCRRGKPMICRKQRMPGNDIHGGFASHVVVPARGLCPVDEARLAKVGLELAELAVIADAVTTPYQAAMRAGIWPGSLAIVVGIGGVGGYAAQVAKAMGATVVAIDIDDTKLAAIARVAASFTLNVRALDHKALRAAVQAFAREKNLPQTEWFIFECSGSAAGQTTAFGLLTHGATLSVVGFTMDRVELRLSNLMAFDARALGNWGCPPELYPGALDLVLDCKIELKPFVETHPLPRINDVFAAANRHELSRRAVLVPV